MPALLAVSATTACGGGTTAQQALKSPEYTADGQTTCHAASISTSPLIVEWPSAARGDLEAIVEGHKSVAVVHFVGCTMTVLSDCTAPGKVSYLPYRNEKQDQLRITTADDLYANLPVGAAKLEGKLERAGELDVDMTLVGQYEATTGAVTRSDLVGSCEGATHVVERISVGAFDFHTAANANVGAGVKVMGAGAGGSSAATRDDIARDGRTEACSNAKPTDTDPPENCGALVRLQLLPLGASHPVPDSLHTTASLTPPVTPSVQRPVRPIDETTWNVHFDAPSGDPTWSLSDRAAIVCTLPCDYGVGTRSVLSIAHANHPSDTLLVRGADFIGNPPNTALVVKPHAAGGFQLGFQLSIWSFLLTLGSSITYGVECGGSGCSALPTVAGIGGISLGVIGLTTGIIILSGSHLTSGIDIDRAKASSGVTITGFGPGGFAGTF
jgi:hypothetical protein